MRNEAADLAKGIAILLMIQVHLTEVFAKTEISTGLFGQISLFLGGTPVAPLFMIIMGYFLAQSQRTFKQLMIRGIIIVFIALLLNTGLNFHLLLKIYNQELILDPWRYILGIDILFLAGLSIISIALLRFIFKKKLIFYLFACLLILLLTPFVTSGLPHESDYQYLFAFIGGQYHWSYFPLFPWLAYPVLGYGYFLLHQHLTHFLSDKGKMWLLLLAGLISMLTISYGISIATTLTLYYHHGIMFFLWNVFFLLFWVLLLNLLENDLGKYTVFIYIKWLGRHVTMVYVFQWLIIGNVGTAIYKTFDLSQLMISYLLIIALVSILVYLNTKIRHLFWQKKLPA